MSAAVGRLVVPTAVGNVLGAGLAAVTAAHMYSEAARGLVDVLTCRCRVFNMKARHRWRYGSSFVFTKMNGLKCEEARSV